MKFLFLLLLLTGCLDRDDKEERFERTPNDHKVQWHDRGAIGTNYATKNQVFAEFDVAVERASLELERAGYGYTADQWKTFAKAHSFYLHDHLWFWYEHQTGWYQVTGFHEDTVSVGLRIGLAYWSYGTSPDPADIPADAPPWTVYQGTTTGNWYWGLKDGPRYPTMAHELANHVGISHKMGYSFPD